MTCYDIDSKILLLFVEEKDSIRFCLEEMI